MLRILLSCEFLTADLFQGRQFVMHHVPQDVVRHAFLVVTENVSDGRHPSPWNFRMPGFQLIR